VADTNTPPLDSTDPAPETAQKRQVRIILVLAACAALIAIVAFAIHHETWGKYQQSTDDAYVAADGVTIAPKVAGYVTKVFVIDNQDVKAGDPLVEVDPRDYKAQSAQFVAQVDVAKANAAGVTAQISEQQAAIAKAEADLAAARQAAAYANGEVARYTPLAATGADTRDHLAQLKNDAARADAQSAAASAALDAAHRRIATLQAQVGQASAQGEAARAQLDAANTNLASTLIRATVDGRVGDKSVQAGQFVQPASRLLTLVPVSQMYITANFKETQMGLMRVGQPVSVHVDALPGVEIAARVQSISPGTGAQFSILPPQNATGNFTKIVQRVPVRIAIFAGPETRSLLVPGMSVSVDVNTISARDANDRIAQEQKSHNAAAGQ